VSDEPVERAIVQRVNLAHEPGSASSREDHGAADEDRVQRFKQDQLRSIVMDEPWDTSLTWTDAQFDLDVLAPAERDRVVAEVLLQLYDEGLAYFFEIADFGESYRRTPLDEEKLPRARLVTALRQGSHPVDGGLSAPFLGVRATERGRAHLDEDEGLASSAPSDRDLPAGEGA
jgi:hypothetical protein